MANFYTPDTAVYLCNVPINSNQKNQFVPYTSVQNGTVWVKDQYQDQQRQWFSEHTTHSFTDFTYQRKDNIIRVPVNAETLFADGTNYCYYQNTHYNGKWFYCFIERIEFINENMTALHIKTDVFQTWFFEFYKSNHMDVNFIARETVIKDEMFKHTLSENLPTGDLKIAQYYDITQASLNAQTVAEYETNYWCVISVSEPITNIGDYLIGYNTWGGGSPIGAYMYACDLSSFNGIIKIINESGKIGSVISCVSMPKAYVDYVALSGGSNPPTPPSPPLPQGTYLNSPYSEHFTVSQTYGYQQAQYFHYGIDMYGAGTNPDLYANTNGLVIASLYHNSFGGIVIIESTSFNTGDNTKYYFMYCHMNSRAVSAGETVTVGQNIGTQGNTGASEGSHCHFEVQKHDDLDVMYSQSEVGNTFGHDVIDMSQSVDPTTFMDITNTTGYK